MPLNLEPPRTDDEVRVEEDGNPVGVAHSGRRGAIPTGPKQHSRSKR